MIMTRNINPTALSTNIDLSLGVETPGASNTMPTTAITIESRRAQLRVRHKPEEIKVAIAPQTNRT